MLQSASIGFACLGITPSNGLLMWMEINADV
jgi:hypothetical protein